METGGLDESAKLSEAVTDLMNACERLPVVLLREAIRLLLTVLVPETEEDGVLDGDTVLVTEFKLVLVGEVLIYCVVERRDSDTVDVLDIVHDVEGLSVADGVVQAVVDGTLVCVFDGDKVELTG